MSGNTLQVKSFGQIVAADLIFGDLTVIIGPQASGKSIMLQLFKLLRDSYDITANLKKHGYDWRNDPKNLLDLYFGENLSSLWRQSTSIRMDEKEFTLESLLRKERKPVKEKVFYIPAQRVMTLDNGWPKPFTGFRVGDPYVVKNFSEDMRLLMEGLGGVQGLIFPQERRLKKTIRDHLDHSIFHGAQVELDSSGLQRRIVLKVGDMSLPYMTWSAGQREFLPLLLGIDWLMPPAAISKKAEVDWVIIEEPEMGLHPRAILSLVLIFLDLIWRGYKLIISTHSTIIPQAIWAIQKIQKLDNNVDNLFELFTIEKNSSLNQVFQDALGKKSYLTYYFDHRTDGVHSYDISSLDPGNEHDEIADWGGLTEFSTTVSEVISRIVMEKS